MNPNRRWRTFPGATPLVAALIGMAALAGVSRIVGQAGAGEKGTPDTGDAPSGKEGAPRAPTETEGEKLKGEQPNDPDFASLDELHRFFEPLQGELRTEMEQLERAAYSTRRRMEELRKRMRELDERVVRALERLSLVHPKAEDIGGARYELTMLVSRLERWEDTIRHADSYLAAHRAESEDLTRSVRFLCASAMLELKGREADAATALAAVLADYPGSIEGEMARGGLLRAMLFLNRAKDAKKLIEQALADPEIAEDADARAWLDGQRHNIEKIGTAFPSEGEVKKPEEGATEKVADLLKGRAVFWYWDSTSGPSASALEVMRNTAAALPADVAVIALSVNQSEEAWRQFVAREAAGKLRHLFEGRVGANTTAAKLGVSAIPFLVLVNADGTIFRYDVPLAELLRSVELWPAKS